MSAVLGPIHYWLYNKIQLQQAIVDELYELGAENGLTLKEECEQLYGSFENKPLEEMIDQGNIHGWLQERVSQVEYKYAYSVTKLLKEKPETLGSLEKITADNALNLAVTLKEFPYDPSGIYKSIGDNLLDGMPCDHAIRVIHQDSREVTWTKEFCVHSRYWDEVGGDLAVYYRLRDIWIEAFVKELGFLFDKPDQDIYRVRACGAD